MTKYLAGVLTVIAVGVLLVAYGLLNPRATLDATTAMAPVMRPAALSEPVSMQMQAAPYAMQAAGVPVGYGYAPAAAAPAYAPVAVAYVPAPAGYAPPAVINAPAPRQARTVTYAPEPARRATTRRVEARPKNDWKRAAMIIGGSSAAGAGVGAIVGGKKGALIGAAIGGGASTIYQVAK